ncbi:MAG: Ig domain-containing protein [Candidatus Dojkabacteria bacterium]|nr:Ig domain-containing protein [Candidatus Dojkabacteria bacterium]
MKEGLKNWLVIFSIVTVSALIVHFGFFYQKDESSEVLGIQEVNYKYAPYITSIAPISLLVGDEFNYTISVSDLDSQEDDLIYFLTEKPEWLYIDNNVVYGIPYKAGTYKFVLTVSDGVNSTSQINYIVVENEE